MKNFKKILSLLLVISTLITMLSCSFITASAQTAEKLNVITKDGKELPIKEMKGFPEGYENLEFFNNDDDDDPYSQSRLNWVVATGSTWNDVNYESRPFVSYSIDGVNYTSIFVDELAVFNKYESKFEKVDYNYVYVREYGDGAYYFKVDITVENPSLDYYDFIDVFIKTEDFIDWEEVDRIPTFSKDVEIAVPDGAWYEGEYNGVHIASEDADIYFVDEIPTSVTFNYYISYDGVNWKKKTTPELNPPEDECASPPLYESAPYMMVTSSGIIFWFDVWSVTYCSRVCEFQDYYITTDFENYEKIGLSSLGECKSEIDIEGMTMTYDQVELNANTDFDNKPVFLRWIATDGLHEVYDEYDEENYYYPNEEYLNSKLEIYTLNEETMSLEPFETIDNCNYSLHWLFSTDHMWIMSQTVEGDWYINIFEGEESRRYAWDGTESFNAFSTTSSWDEEGKVWVNEENLCNVKTMLGIKNDDTFFLTTDDFETVYEYSLAHLGDEVYYDIFTHQQDMIIYTYDEDYNIKYYLIDKSQIEELQEDVYNFGEETYSFSNFGDTDSPYGHCFGMSMTSSAYYNNIMDIKDVGGNEYDDVYGLGYNSNVKDPICYYQNRQGYTVVKNSTVAGGKFYKDRVWDISSDWADVVNYVKNHEYDNTGLLQVCYYKNYGEAISGHAVNFLYYKVVNGQERIYVYDNNFPDVETYFYMGADGKVHQAPYETFPGGFDAIQLIYIPTYFQFVGTYDFSRYIYAEQGNIKVVGAVEYYEFSDSESSRVIFEVPADEDAVKIIPLKDNATFEYADEEYTFANVDENTVGVLELTTKKSTIEPDFTIKNAGDDEYNYVFAIREPSTTTIRYKDGIVLHINESIPEGTRVEWSIDSNAFDGGTYDNGMNCLLVSKNNGYATVIATLYDANNNAIATDSVELRSKAGFFDKIGGFFRGLFGMTKVYDA